MSTNNPNERARTVLVVDDVAGNRAILCRRLSRIGYNCVEAESGEAALGRLRQFIPDVILLDYMMPQMSGIEMLRTIKSDSSTDAIPVIMVTARAEGAAIAAALDAGADDYVSKPIDFTNLDARIRNVLNRSYRSSEVRKINETLDNRIAMRALELAEVEQELETEKSRCQKLEREISTQCMAEGKCEDRCRDGNLVLINHIGDLISKAWQPDNYESFNSVLLSEIQINIDSIRQNLMARMRS